METMTHIEQISAQRDVIVLSRICILLGSLLTVFIPSIITFLIKLFSGYLPWCSSQIQWLTFSLTITCIAIVLAIVFPHVRNLWKRDSHGHDPKPVGSDIVKLNQVISTHVKFNYLG